MMTAARWAIVPALAVLLAACGGGDDDATPAPTPTGASPTATATTSVTATASSTPTLTPTARSVDYFVATVHAGAPEVTKKASDVELGKLANQICDDLDAKKSGDDVVAHTQTLGGSKADAVDQATARELVKAAMDSVCPEHADRVDEF